MPAREVAISEVSRAMLALKRGVLDELERRDLNATGRMSKSVEDEVTENSIGIKGTLTALDYWVNVGSGSPPRTNADITDLKEWVIVRNLVKAGDSPGDFAAFIHDNIRDFGSNDWIAGNPNAFQTAFDVWAASAEVKELGNRTANEYGDSYVEILRTNLTR